MEVLSLDRVRELCGVNNGGGFDILSKEEEGFTATAVEMVDAVTEEMGNEEEEGADM
jgi:hypothetical protein